MQRGGPWSLGIEVDKLLVGGLVSPTYGPWFGRPFCWLMESNDSENKQAASLGICGRKFENVYTNMFPLYC